MKCFFLVLLLPVSLVSQPLEIYQIQGDGVTSPYLGRRVQTAGSIVTLLANDGFYMQTPEGRSDNNPVTSDGIFVLTGGRPNLSAGDQVVVEGKIGEYFGMTRFEAGAAYLRTGSGANLPAPVTLDVSLPSKTPQPVPSLERVEGMRVRLSGYASGPGNRFGECPVTVERNRPFREPGLRWPGRPGLPLWDGNPEIFWFLIPEGEPAAGLEVATGTGIQATGVLSYRFGKYTLLPDTFSLDPATAFRGRSVRSQRPGEFAVGSLNVRRLLRSDTLYLVRLRKLAAYIVDQMRAPDVLALQELGDEGVLKELAEHIRRIDPSLDYRAHFKTGNDLIHSAFLTGSRIRVERLEQLAAAGRFSLGGPLHDRPPLLLAGRMEETGAPFQVLNLHLRSSLGLEEADSLYVRRKRYEQALSVAGLVQERQDSNLIVAGDFNATPFSDGYVDVVNTISGQPSLGALLPAEPGRVAPALNNLALEQAPQEQYSFVFEGYAELIDHCLVSAGLRRFRVAGLQFARGNADAPEPLAGDPGTPLRASDHDGWVLFLESEATVAVSAPEAESVLRINGPNPARAGSTFMVTANLPGPVSIDLFSLNGQLLWSKKDNRGNFQFQLPGTIAPGSCFLHISQATVSKTHKLIIR